MLVDTYSDFAVRWFNIRLRLATPASFNIHKFHWFVTPIKTVGSSMCDNSLVYCIVDNAPLTRSFKSCVCAVNDDRNDGNIKSEPISVAVGDAQS
jgi:hypothetical protein